jgi:hypothetical protein
MLLSLMSFVRIIERAGCSSRGCTDAGTFSTARESADGGASSCADADAFSGSHVPFVPYRASLDGAMHVVVMRDLWSHSARRPASPQDQTQEQNEAQ